MIYLDNYATTRLDPRVLAAMMPFFTEEYANAASTHPFGLRARARSRETGAAADGAAAGLRTSGVNLYLGGH